MDEGLKALVDRELAILNRTMDDLGYEGEYRGSIESKIAKSSYTPDLIVSISFMYMEGRAVPVDVQRAIRLLEEGLAFVGDGYRGVALYYRSLAHAYLRVGRDSDYRRCIGEAARCGGFHILNREELKTLMSEGDPGDISTVACICCGIAGMFPVPRYELNEWAARFLEMVGKADNLDYHTLDALVALSGSGLDDRNAASMAGVRERLKGMVDGAENRSMLMRTIAEMAVIDSEEEYRTWMKMAAMEGDSRALEYVLDPWLYNDVPSWESAVSRYADGVGASDVARALKRNWPILGLLNVPAEILDTLKQYMGEDEYFLASEGLRMMAEGDYEGCVRCYLKSGSAERHLASAVARIFLDGLSTPADKALAIRIMGGCGDFLFGTVDVDPELRKEVAERFGLELDDNGMLKADVPTDCIRFDNR